MSSYSVAEAKNSLPALIDKALAGEEVVITRRGREVVEICARIKAQPVYGSTAWLLDRERPRPVMPAGFSSSDLIRQMRDEGY